MERAGSAFVADSSHRWSRAMFAIQVGNDLGVDISSDVLKEAEGFVAWHCMGLKPFCFQPDFATNEYAAVRSSLRDGHMGFGSV
jgi:hypothetical protein